MRNKCKLRGARDTYTKGLSPRQRFSFQIAAILHDTGKHTYSKEGDF